MFRSFFYAMPRGVHNQYLGGIEVIRVRSLTASGQRTIVSRSGTGFGSRGGSEYLPQASAGSGMQAPCCLSPAFVVCPGDKPPGEFRVRPEPVLDKGTGAQHRQVLSPETQTRSLNGVFTETLFPSLQTLHDCPKKNGPQRRRPFFRRNQTFYSALLAVFLAAVFLAAVFLAAVFFTAVFLAAALVAVFLAADLRPGFSGRGSNSKPILPSA